MVTKRQINKLARFIAERFRPERIILFGSYAYGTPNEDSDVDLLVVMPVRGHVVEKAIEIYRAMDALGAVPPALDLMVRSPAQLRRRIALNDFFLREIVERGKVLYDRSGSRMGGEGRGGLRGRAARATGPQVAKL
jgi:predicted nucleotidyltransferase